MGYRVPWLRRTAAAVGTASLVLGGSMPAAFAHDSVIVEHEGGHAAQLAAKAIRAAIANSAITGL